MYRSAELNALLSKQFQDMVKRGCSEIGYLPESCAKRRVGEDEGAGKSMNQYKLKSITTKKIILDALATEFPSDLFSYYDLMQFYIEKLPSKIKEIKLACVISPE